MKTKKQKSLGVKSGFTTPYLKIVDVRDDNFYPYPKPTPPESPTHPPPPPPPPPPIPTRLVSSLFILKNIKNIKTLIQITINPPFLASVVECSIFQKDRALGGEGSRVRVPVKTVYYIITKVFICKKTITVFKKHQNDVLYVFKNMNQTRA